MWFYQRFVVGYAQIVAPLTDLLRKDVDWYWNPAHEKAFQNLKQSLLESVVLTFPDRYKPYIVHTDTSDVALGATLSQEDKHGSLRLIACASPKLSAAERNYPAYENECLAVVDSLQHWRHYLLGAVQVIVHTDNITLKYLNRIKNTSPRMNR